jgi:hypothetical protein
MPGLPKSQRVTISRIGVTLSSASASASATGLGVLALAVHDLAAAIACWLGGAALAAVAALCYALPDIVKARPGIIKAKSEREDTRARARRRDYLLKAGVKRKLDAKTFLLQLQVLDADVLKDPTYAAALRAALPDPRFPSDPETGLTVVHRAEATLPGQGEPGESDLGRAS